MPPDFSTVTGLELRRAFSAQDPMIHPSIGGMVGMCFKSVDQNGTTSRVGAGMCLMHR